MEFEVTKGDDIVTMVAEIILDTEREDDGRVVLLLREGGCR